jgi:hypothetical protein
MCFKNAFTQAAFKNSFVLPIDNIEQIPSHLKPSLTITLIYSIFSVG